MASHLLWEVVKRNHCFLMKRGNEKFSRDPLNLKGKNCFKYIGLVHKKAYGVKEQFDGKGVVLVTKKAGYSNKPAKAVVKTKYVRGRRRSLRKMSNFATKQKYRRELKMLLLRRASALMKNMKPTVHVLPKPKKC